MAAMNVWVATQCMEYDSDIPAGVYSTRERAIEAIKAQYPPPNKVRWIEDDDGLLGDFYEFVMGLHTEHKQWWAIEEVGVDANLPAPTPRTST